MLFTASGSKSYVVVSDELQHDKFAVTAFNRAILNDAVSSGINIQELHMFSDGAGSQFKNRFILSQVAQPSLLHANLRSLDWSFFATAHGKGPVDGVGGTVKRAVWRRILQEKVVVNSAHEFYQCAQQCCPNVCMQFVQSSEIAQVRSELEGLWAANEPRRIPVTHDLHFAKAASSTSLLVSAVSPFLMVPVNHVTPDISVPSRAVQIFHSQEASSSVVPSNDSPAVTVEVDKYYAVDYVNRFYIGRVLKPGSKTDYWCMKFLHQYMRNGEVRFHWPRAADCDEVHSSVIFFGPLTLIGVRQFKVEELCAIKTFFDDIKKQ